MRSCRDRRQAAPGAFARQCAALGGPGRAAVARPFEGELDIPAGRLRHPARAASKSRWSRQRAGRAEDDLTHGRWAKRRAEVWNAIALDARTSEPRTRGGLARGSGCSTASRRSHHRPPRASRVTSPPRDRHGGPRDGDDALRPRRARSYNPAAPAPAPVAPGTGRRRRARRGAARAATFRRRGAGAAAAASRRRPHPEEAQTLEEGKEVHASVRSLTARRRRHRRVDDVERYLPHPR